MNPVNEKERKIWELTKERRAKGLCPLCGNHPIYKEGVCKPCYTIQNASEYDAGL